MYSLPEGTCPSAQGLRGLPWQPPNPSNWGSTPALEWRPGWSQALGPEQSSSPQQPLLGSLGLPGSSSDLLCPLGVSPHRCRLTLPLLNVGFHPTSSTCFLLLYLPEDTFHGKHSRTLHGLARPLWELCCSLRPPSQGFFHQSLWSKAWLPLRHPPLPSPVRLPEAPAPASQDPDPQDLAVSLASFPCTSGLCTVHCPRFPQGLLAAAGTEGSAPATCRAWRLLPGTAGERGASIDGLASL